MSTKDEVDAALAYIKSRVKRCREPERTPAGKYRFCKECLEHAKKFRVEDEMLRQAREGMWICPNAKEQCGKKIS